MYLNKNIYLTLILLLSVTTNSSEYKYLVTPLYGSGLVQIVDKKRNVLEEYDTKKTTFHARLSEKKLIVAHIDKQISKSLRGSTGEINIYDTITKRNIFTYKNPALHHDFYLFKNFLYVIQWKKIEKSNLYGDELIEIDIKKNKITRRLSLNRFFKKELKLFKGTMGSFSHINSINLSDWDSVNKRKLNVITLTSRKSYGPKKEDPHYEWNAAAFYSPFIGGVQSLSNGNILVTIGNTGRVLEISTENKIIWDQPAFAQSITNVNGHPSQQIFKVKAYLREK